MFVIFPIFYISLDLRIGIESGEYRIRLSLSLPSLFLFLLQSTGALFAGYGSMKDGSHSRTLGRIFETLKSYSAAQMQRSCSPSNQLAARTSRKERTTRLKYQTSFENSRHRYVGNDENRRRVKMKVNERRHLGGELREQTKDWNDIVVQQTLRRSRP